MSIRSRSPEECQPAFERPARHGQVPGAVVAGVPGFFFFRMTTGIARQNATTNAYTIQET
jgi:hypothetical protein